MRVLSPVALVIVLSLSLPLSAGHLESECPLTLVGSNAGDTEFALSPHGAFRDGANLYVLRGQTLSTYTATNIGELQVVREDFIGSLGARETAGGAVFHNGHLYVSGEAGLEVYDLSDVADDTGGPVLVSRTPDMHYHKLVASGTTLAGLYPAQDLPCAPTNTLTCFNMIDIISISNPASPTRVGQISSIATSTTIAFYDIAFNRGFLYAATERGLNGYSLANPSAPATIISDLRFRGHFLVSNGDNILGIGNDEQIQLHSINFNGVNNRFAILVLPFGVGMNRANRVAFHPQAWIDDQNGRLITMINEIDPLTGDPARTVAFDVFDYAMARYEGAFERIYEDITYVTPDEVKYNPLAVGTSVFTVGERSGLQVWAGCGAPSGRIVWSSTQGLNCGGTQLHGWVTGPDRISNVEIFLDGASLGTATLSGPPRTDVSSKFPVHTWRLPVNFDQTARGEYTLRAVATDSAGVRRQFAEQRVFFNGPGQNCVTRRRAVR